MRCTACTGKIRKKTSRFDIELKKMKLPRNSDLLSRAKEMRRNMTKQEFHLWADFLRDFKPRFRR